MILHLITKNDTRLKLAPLPAGTNLREWFKEHTKELARINVKEVEVQGTQERLAVA